ncbi:MAG: hypothetical protein IV090_18520 [Candidatus Sericytochromatia bacterium]|nr:hypothetical protein [Candidatus Sericytochromatia bacterium]
MNRLILALWAWMFCFCLGTAQAQTSPPKAKDLPLDHWGLEAVRALSEKYAIFSLYPDQTFRGDQFATRYEQAIAFWGLMKWLEQKSDECWQTKGYACGFLLGLDEYPLQRLASKDLLALSLIPLLKKNDPLNQSVAQQSHLNQASLAILGPDIKQLIQSVAVQERFQVHGQVEMRYRDRVAAQTELEFGDEQPQRLNSPRQSYLTTQDLIPFQVRTQLQLQAGLTDSLKVFTGFDILVPTLEQKFVSGFPVDHYFFNNGGHDLNEGTAIPSSFFFREGYLDWLHFPQADLGLEIKAGLFNFSQDLNPGTRLKSLFDQPFWNGHSYGLVGWGANEWVIPPSHSSQPDKSLYKYWVGGLSPSMVDPDSHRYNQASSPALSFQTNWEGGAYFIGLNGGSSQTNIAAAAKGNLRSGSEIFAPEFANNPIDRSAIYPGAVLPDYTCFYHSVKGNTCSIRANHLALPSQSGDGYMVTGLDLYGFEEIIPMRLNLSAMAYLNDNLLEFAKPTRKEISGTLDLGWDQGFGLSLGVNKSFIGYDRYSLGMFFNQLGGTELDFQLGANFATQQGLFNFSDVPFSNIGFALSLPLYQRAPGADQINFLLASRQSLGANWGRPDALQPAVTPPLFKEAGITLSLDYLHIAGTPLQLRFEYHLLFLDALWQGNAVAQDLLLLTRYSF